MDDFDTSLHSINETEISPEYGSQAAIAEDEVNEVKKLTKKESKGVWIWKFLVVVTTVATAALVSSGSYLLLRHEETNSFETSVSQMNDRGSRQFCRVLLLTQLLSLLSFTCLPTRSGMLPSFIFAISCYQ